MVLLFLLESRMFVASYPRLGVQGRGLSAKELLLAPVTTSCCVLEHHLALGLLVLEAPPGVEFSRAVLLVGAWLSPGW